MVEPAQWTAEFHLGASQTLPYLYSFADTSVLCEAVVNQGMVVEMTMSLLTAKASTTEEPREGKLHAGICAGSAGLTGVPTVTVVRRQNHGSNNRL